MFGLQGLGAIGAGVMQGAEELRKQRKDKRDEEMFGLQKKAFGWQEEQQAQLKQEREASNLALKRYQDTLKAIDTDGDGVADSFVNDYNRQQDGLKDGMYARLIRDPKSNKVTHVNYSSRADDAGAIGSTVEFSPELLRAAAKSRFMAEMGAVSPEKFQQMTALQLQLDQFDRQGKQFGMSYEQADRIARERNATTERVYAGNNDTALKVAKIRAEGGSGTGEARTAASYMRAFTDLTKAFVADGMSPNVAAQTAKLQLQRFGYAPSKGMSEEDAMKTIISQLTADAPKEPPKQGLPTADERKTKPLPENWKPVTPYERAQATRPDGGKRLADRDAAGVAALRQRLANVKTIEDAIAVQDDSYFSALSREEKQGIFNKVMGR